MTFAFIWSFVPHLISFHSPTNSFHFACYVPDLFLIKSVIAKLSKFECIKEFAHPRPLIFKFNMELNKSDIKDPEQAETEHKMCT